MRPVVQNNTAPRFTPPPPRKPHNLFTGAKGSFGSSTPGGTPLKNEKVGGFIVKVERPSGGQSPGFIIAVGKRVFPKAVDRNLLKRRIRAALRELGVRPVRGREGSQCAPASNGIRNLGEKFKIRIMALPAAKTATYQEIKFALKNAIENKK